MRTSETPALSVVVTVVDGGEVLARHLEALSNQQGDHNLEVLVPYDQACHDVAALADRYPSVRFVDLGTVLGGISPSNPMETHAFYDTRRTEALKLAKSRLIAITEDRGIPKSDWADAMIQLHDKYQDGVIGGAVENGVDRLWNWAVYFCDFSRYQPPLDIADPEYVTDTNICYKRAPLMSVSHLWETVYQEAEVNWAMRRQGVGLRLNDAAKTVQHRKLDGPVTLAGERFHWARLFGMMRGRELSRIDCMKYAVLTPILPLVLFIRHLRRQLHKGRHVRKFIQAGPLTFFLLVCWSAGELVGYIEALRGRTGKTGSMTGGEAS